MPSFLLEFSEILKSNSTVFIGIAVVLGLMVGSFLNVVIHRLPKMMEREWHNNCLELQGQTPISHPKYNIVSPRSACPSCGHAITALENIPIVSYLFLRGKCKGCHAPISARYPLIEALTGALIGLVAYQYGYTSTTLFVWVFVLALITLAFIDFDTQLLPDDITLPLLWLGLLLNANEGGFVPLKSAVMGAVIGYLILWAVYWAFKLITGKEGMGYGDFKLLAALGAWFGVMMLPTIILLSSVLGAVIGIALIALTKRGRDVPMPFGPFLVIGGLASLFFGQIV